MSDQDFPSAAWQQPPDAKGSDPGDGGFFRSLWRRFRGWPIWAQIATWIVIAVFVLAGIGLATESDDDDDGGGEDESAEVAASSDREPTTTTSTTTTTTSTTTTTTTTPPTPAQVVTGQGDSVVDVTFPQDEPAIVHIVGAGTANFVVWSYDDAGQQLDLLVNVIGAYDGVRPLNFLEDAGVARLQVQADGPWTIEIKPLDDAERAVAPGRFDGNGDQVLVLDGEADTAYFVNGATDNFVVWAWGARSELLVNEIAPYEGTVIVPADTVVLDVVATGPWSVDFT